MDANKTTRLLGPLFAPGDIGAVFNDTARLQGMLDFEAALARAEAKTGVIPKSAVDAIENECRAEQFDISTLADAAASAGNVAIPLIKELTARVARKNPEAGGFVHWGATSQDVMDTGLILQLRAALRLIEKKFVRITAALAKLASTHKNTPMVGRTWLQQALPITFGLKVAGWLSAIHRHHTRLHELEPRVFVVQFGGAAGTLASLGNKGMDVATALAAELDLQLPNCPWHTQRDRVAEVATVLGLLVGTLGKMARDVSLMMQTEIGEAAEPSAPGKGGSSTMPHKRNPVGCAVALSAAVRVPGLVSTMLSAMVQEHERGLGGWHAEWDTLPQICELCAGALVNMTQVIEGLDVDSTHMRASVDITHGLILAEAVTMALGRTVGRMSAHERVENAGRKAVAQKRPLRDVLAEDPEVTKHLSTADLDKLFDPNNYLGSASQIVERVLAQLPPKNK